MCYSSAQLPAHTSDAGNNSRHEEVQGPVTSLLPTCIAGTTAPGVHQNQANINTLPARLLSAVLDANSEQPLQLMNTSTIHGRCGQDLEKRSVVAPRPVITLDEDGMLPPVGVLVQDQLGAPLASWQLSKQTKVEAKVQSTNGAVAVLEGQSQLVPDQGQATFAGMRLLGPPGGNFTVFFAVSQLASGAIPLEYQSAPLNFSLRPCTVGQVVQISQQGFLIGCTTCQPPLYSFDPTSTGCLKCPAKAAQCGGGEMRPRAGFFQWHPLSTELMECPHVRSCNSDDKALAVLQAAAVQAASAARIAGSSRESKLAILRDERMAELYQQLQCSEGEPGSARNESL